MEDLLDDLDVFTKTCQKVDGSKKWKKLVESLNKHLSVKIDPEDLKKYEHGGGNPTEELLGIFETSHPSLTVGDVIKDVIKVERFKCSVKTQSKVNSIDSETRRQLENMLNEGPPSDSMMPWKRVAKKFGISQDIIENIKSRNSAPKEFSPTKQLFICLTHENPETSLQVIVNGLREIGLLDVCKILEDKMEYSQQEHIVDIR